MLFSQTPINLFETFLFFWQISDINLHVWLKDQTRQTWQHLSYPYTINTHTYVYSCTFVVLLWSSSNITPALFLSHSCCNGDVMLWTSSKGNINVSEAMLPNWVAPPCRRFNMKKRLARKKKRKTQYSESHWCMLFECLSLPLVWQVKFPLRENEP